MTAQISKITVNGWLLFNRIIPLLWDDQKPKDCSFNRKHLKNLTNADPWRAWILREAMDIKFTYKGKEYYLRLKAGFITDKVSNPFRNDAFAAMVPALFHDYIWATGKLDFALMNDIFYAMMRCDSYKWNGEYMKIRPFSKLRAGYYKTGVTLARHSYENQPLERRVWSDYMGELVVF